MSAKSFFVYHTQQLSAAAQVGDAKGIRKKITEMKMRLIKHNPFTPRTHHTRMHTTTSKACVPAPPGVFEP